MVVKATKRNMVRHIAKTLDVTPAEAESLLLVVMRYIRKRFVADRSVILSRIGTLAETEGSGAIRYGRIRTHPAASDGAATNGERF